MNTKTLVVLLLALCAMLCAATQRKPFMLNSRKIYYNEPELTEEELNKPAQNFNANPFEYSGYFNVNATFGANMYYAFFPAQDGNVNAPVILWLQGGPGCSSMDGLFLENGPYHVTPDLTLVQNPYTWAKKYNLLYIDNPVGAGFSYVEKKDGYVTNEEQMSKELYSALTQFFGKYNQYAKNAFYVFGESYAGKYVPAIAYRIANEGFKINLKGIGIGDGLTHPIEQFTAYSDYSFANGLINQAQKDQVKIYEKNITDAINQEKWIAAMTLVDNMSNQVNNWGGNFNVYDIREFGDYDFDAMVKYLALPSTKVLMHTEGHAYHDCDQRAYEQLYADMPQSVRFMVIELLNKGLPIILYNGQFDWIINNVGSEQWINNMPWKSQKEFLAAKRTTWKVNGNVAGWHQTFGPLQQVIVVGAGHLSPMNQPLHLQDMVTRFIENKPFN